ncbi:MAG: 1-acyl-sn-glycerol-3-phosphate acyltransferase, partial [Desulfatiglandales bacterium]
MFLKRIQVDRDRVSLLRSIKEKASLVLVSKHYSRLDYWVFSRRLMKEGIGPVADLRSLIREEFSLKEWVLKIHGPGQIPYMALYDPGLFKRGYLKGSPHPLETLIASLPLLEKPVYMVPLTILYRNSLNKLRPSFWDILFGYGENPGVIRKALIFLRFSRDCVLSIGEPILISPGDRASSIRERIQNGIDLEKRVCLGPLFRGKQEIKEEVLTDKRVLEVIEGFSKGDPQAEKKARKEAEKYFEEIASDYSPFFAQLFVAFLNWLWPRIFEGIEISQEELLVVKEAARKATIVYVPSHRSHVDYLILNHMLHLNMLHSPRIAAGVNLLFWPMGTLFRKAGAFFIRRAFRGAKLYTAVFTSYLKMLIKEGYPIEFFIEGGRSRTGKLVNPKAGLLTLILSTYLEERGKNIAFVPVSIVYDKVPEDEEYAQELMGKEKEKESTLQLIRAVRFLKKRYGKVYIRFGKPIYADESLKSETADLADQAQELADQIAISINRITVVTPLSLVSAAVLSKFRGGFTKEQLKEALNNYVSY